VPRAILLTAALLFPLQALAAEAGPKVLVSIAPLHSLAAAVMAGVGPPELLMPASASPHDFSLKPSQAKSIQDADLVVWAGPQLEGFLTKTVKAAEQKGKLLTMGELPGLVRHEAREGGPWDAHEHAHNDEAKHALEIDGHFWLDIGNAKLLADALADRLSLQNPFHAAQYRQNARDLATKLDRLDRELKADLAPLAGKPYVVYHDAFQYFEKRYGLTPAGSITLEERNPSAKKIAALRRKISEVKAACVFKEPQAPARPAEMVAEGLSVRFGTLDDLGSSQAPGPDLYPNILKGVAADLRRCLLAAASTDR
jgi:zinc transport system substrate-binding protein